MSVLIKGMEMPKNCGECPLIDQDYGICPMIDGYMFVGSKRQDRHPLCPLEEVKEEEEWALKTSDQKQTSR